MPLREISGARHGRFAAPPVLAMVVSPVCAAGQVGRAPPQAASRMLAFPSCLPEVRLFAFLQVAKWPIGLMKVPEAMAAPSVGHTPCQL